MTLDEFIKEAKLNTFAAGNISVENNVFSCRYEKDEYLYEDRYVGQESFAGQEIIFKNGVPVKSMVYSGVELEPLGVSGRKFLQTCLKIGAEQGCFRGPARMAINDYEYSFMIEPDKTCEEIITYKHKLIFCCNFIINTDIEVYK